ncbi:ComEC/Rec2 family competence protein [Maribacter sp. 2304DJ31-5]|uniref:ComEC/Rec2 family competence protein n=1 Tax=Maribacter sp. 2304DJ31-5 TaxID=3386273 RepID=UPI0039BD7036
MKLLDFVPIKLALALILGILIGHFFQIHLPMALGLTILFLIGLGLVYYFEKKATSVLFGILTLLTTIALGIFIMVRAQPINHTSHYSHLNTQEAAQWELKILETLKPTSFSKRYIASVTKLQDTLATGKLMLNFPLDTTLSDNLKVDDEIVVHAKIEAIKPPFNPHQFDYRSYMEKLGIYHQMKLNKGGYVKKKRPSSTILGMAEKIRGHIIRSLKKYNFGKNELAIIQALLLGQRNDISNDTYTDYKDAGAVHILALSGLHIGILLFFINFLLRPLERLPKGKTLKLIITVFLLWGFAFIAGLSPSIIRACAMFTFIAYALYLNRPSNNFNILALSILFILLFIDPDLLFQVGFQMSYVAVFAIVWIYPLFQKFWFPKNKVIRYFWQLLSVSIAAQLGVLPISLFYFHQFPGLFFISNVLIVPFLGFVLGMGILTILLSLLNYLPDWLVLIFNKIIGIMNTLIQWVAEQEAFIFRSISFDSLQLLLSYLLIISLVPMFVKAHFKRVGFFLVCLLGFQSWTIYQLYEASRTKEVLILHQTKNTVIFNRNGRHLNVLSNTKNALGNLIRDYKIGERIDSVSFAPLKNSYTIGDRSLFILDSTGIYPEQPTANTILITGSPKINLDRLITTLRPKNIIADGSNYKSYVKQWKETCLQQKLPFHHTGEKGVYYFKSN